MLLSGNSGIILKDNFMTFDREHYIVCGDYTVLEKISPKAIVEFNYNFHNDPKYKHLRLGQAFLNEFFPGLICSKLFYETDEKEAQQYISNVFVDYNMPTEILTVEIEEQ